MQRLQARSSLEEMGGRLASPWVELGEHGCLAYNWALKSFLPGQFLERARGGQGLSLGLLWPLGLNHRPISGSLVVNGSMGCYHGRARWALFLLSRLFPCPSTSRH